MFFGSGQSSSAAVVSNDFDEWGYVGENEEASFLMQKKVRANKRSESRCFDTVHSLYVKSRD